jgi:mannosyltransferase OCH1-like enzyme
MNSRIPQRIIQIWGGGADLPFLGRCSSVNLKLLNPDFEYVLFDDGKMEKLVVVQIFPFPYPAL